MPRPTIEPLTGPDELTARRVITEVLIDGVWRVSSWADADRQAATLLDRLKAEGVELVSVRWL
jgi:hypothetical protein